MDDQRVITNEDFDALKKRFDELEKKVPMLSNSVNVDNMLQEFDRRLMGHSERLTEIYELLTAPKADGTPTDILARIEALESLNIRAHKGNPNLADLLALLRPGSVEPAGVGGAQAAGIADPEFIPNPMFNPALPTMPQLIPNPARNPNPDFRRRLTGQ